MFRKTFQQIAVKNKQFWQRFSRPDPRNGRFDDAHLNFLDNGPYRPDSASRHFEKFHGGLRRQNFPAEFFNGRPSRGQMENFQRGNNRPDHGMSFQGRKDFWEGGSDRFSSKGSQWSEATENHQRGDAGLFQNVKSKDSGVRMNREEILKYYDKA